MSNQGTDDANRFSTPEDECFDCLLDSELSEIRANRSDNLCGLALSGGGIRSATFALGVLQSLREQKLLEAFHYLSTVSGGGYLGGFWDAYRKYHPDPPSEDNVFLDRDDDLHDDPHIEHLRRFSNFLRPRLLLMSYETGRIITVLVAVILPSLLATIGLISIVFLLWLLATILVTELPWPWAMGAFFAIVRTGHWLIGETWKGATGPEGMPGDDAGIPKVTKWMTSSSLVALVIWFVLWWAVPLSTFHRITPLQTDSGLTLYVVAATLPAIALLAAAVILILARAASGRVKTPRHRRHANLDMAIGSTLYLGTSSLILGLFWFGGQWLAAMGVGGIATTASLSGIGGSAFAMLRPLLNRQPNKPGGERSKNRMGPKVLQIVAYLTLTAAILAVAALLSKIAGIAGLPGLSIALLVATMLAALPLLFYSEENGFHGFYRSRLSRAYLGAAAATPHLATQELETDDFLLTDIPEGKPFHLICCAANDLAGDPIPNLHRGAQSAVLSKLGIQLDKHWRSWKLLEECPLKKLPTPTLGAAMTASAAAFNSHMGAKSMQFGQAVTFLMTALSLRLGLWTVNPRHHCGHQDQLAKDGKVAPPSRIRTRFYRELLGLSDSRRPEIFLSDGAHFDNTGLYELIRRKCQLIVLCDCGADPDYAFDDLANAIRQARTDFGVEIMIDTSSIEPKEGRISDRATVTGEIHYPDRVGILLLIKPALLGDEPADIKQYAERSIDFPQQTTADQFYDEAQWEAYRKLGQHTAGRLFWRLRKTIAKVPTAEGRLRWALTRARHELAPSAKIETSERLQLDTAWHALESELASSSLALDLAREILGPRTKGRPYGQTVDNPEETVRLITRALGLMESAFRTFGLESGSVSREATGWVNRFGRWAGTRSFGDWWPWLAASCSRGLVDFLEENYLSTANRDRHGKIEPLGGCSGYALDRWRVEQKKKASFADTGFWFRLDLGKGSDFMAALVWLKIVDPGNGNPGSGTRKYAIWRDADLFIPSGLWATGIALNFVKALVTHLDTKCQVDRFIIGVNEGEWTPVTTALYSDPKFDTILIAKSDRDKQNPVSTLLDTSLAVAPTDDPGIVA